MLSHFPSLPDPPGALWCQRLCQWWEMGLGTPGSPWALLHRGKGGSALLQEPGTKFKAHCSAMQKKALSRLFWGHSGLTASGGGEPTCSTGTSVGCEHLSLLQPSPSSAAMHFPLGSIWRLQGNKCHNTPPLKLRRGWAHLERALPLPNFSSLIYRATFISVALLPVAIYNTGKCSSHKMPGKSFPGLLSPLHKGCFVSLGQGLPFGEAVGL